MATGWRSGQNPRERILPGFVLERDEEKWTPVFRVNHATTGNRDQDDVSIERHPDLGRIGSRAKGDT